MSGKKRPSNPVGGYEYDLRKAENAMIAAGHPEVADEMRRHSEAIRNYMQGAIVPMFVEMVERSLGPKIDGLRTDVQNWASESAARLKKHDDQLDTIEAWRTGADARMSAIEQADRDDIKTEIKNTNAEIASMKEMLKRYDSELRELVDRLKARGGDDAK